MVEGALVKIREEVGEGIVNFFTSSPELVLGEGATAVKRATIKLPPMGPRGSQVKFSYLTVGVLVPPHLKAPLRWRMELEGVTVSREMKPQMAIELDDGYLYGAMYDTSPILSAKKNSAYGCLLRFSYDSAHPITVVEASMVNGFQTQKASYSMAYLSGYLALEPGESVTIPVSLPKMVGNDTRITVTALVRSPRAGLRVVAGERAEISGPGLKAVELSVKEVSEVRIEYPPQEVKIYPKRAVVTGMIVLNRSLPTPLDVEVVDVRREGSERTVSLLLHNPGREVAEEVAVVIKQSTIVIKEMRVDSIRPGESTTLSVSLDVARLPSRIRRLIVEVRWNKEGIPSSKTVDVDI
ncbi:MAG: hypothetical protein N3D79_02430 [Acidilobaceae archaeon]|nr:hypothetical protein [Acidilobaceae archaeon]